MVRCGLTIFLFHHFGFKNLNNNQLLLLPDSFYVVDHVCDDLVLFHYHICHVRPFLMQVPGNVWTDQQTQVFCCHLIVGAELADLCQVRQQIEKALPAKYKSMADSENFPCPDLLGSSIFNKIRFIFLVAVLAAFCLSRVEKNGSSSFISVSSFMILHGRSGLDNSLESSTLKTDWNGSNKPEEKLDQTSQDVNRVDFLQLFLVDSIID